MPPAAGARRRTRQDLPGRRQFLLDRRLLLLFQRLLGKVGLLDGDIQAVDGKYRRNHACNDRRKLADAKGRSPDEMIPPGCLLR